MIGMQKNKLRKSILAILGVSAMAGYSSQAAAISPATLPVLTGGSTDILQSLSGVPATNLAPKRAWSDYGTNFNYGWTHTASFRIFQVGNAADIASGARFDVTVDLQAKTGVTTGAALNPVAPMNSPAFSIWTSGTNPLVTGAATGSGYGHEWSQVRGALDGGVAGFDRQAVDPSLGSNGWLGSGGGGNLIDGHDGWIGYANAGYSFTNGDGDKVQGRLAGASNPTNIGQYGGGAGDPLNGQALTNVNGSSPYVYTGFATLSAGNAALSLTGLKAGYYLIGWAGACADDNANAQNCGAAAPQAYKLTISNNGLTTVPVPSAVWLFGSALLGMVGFGRRKI
jgi:hypothetical protein